MKRFSISIACTICISLSPLYALRAEEPTERSPVRIGWIGPITGPMVKWGAYLAAQLALEELNADGGVNGQPLQVLFEDGKASGKDAVSAAQKLINVDKVRFILGGHCSPESLPIVPLVQKAGAIMLAAITSSPFLTGAGDNVFRVTAVSTAGTEKVFEYATGRLKARRFAVLYEEGDYPRPQAEKFRELVQKAGLELVSYSNFLRDEADFRSSLVKIRAARPDAVYIAAFSPDFALALFRQIHELGITPILLGNETAGQTVNSSGSNRVFFEKLILASPKADPNSLPVKNFMEKYKARYPTAGPPYGPQTAEAYDSLKLLAGLIERCGEEVGAVRNCLLKVRDYEGASGRFSIDAKGDAVRDYEIQQVLNGQIQILR